MSGHFARDGVFRRSLVDGAQGVSSQQPALWFFGSLLLRMGIVLTGFYFVSGGHWERLLVCLIGFVMARFIVMRFTRAAEKPTYLAQEAGHAP